MDDAAAARIEREFPRWMVLRGVPGGREHAKRPGANGEELALVSGEDETDLRDQITRAESQLNSGPGGATNTVTPGLTPLGGAMSDSTEKTARANSPGRRVAALAAALGIALTAAQCGTSGGSNPWAHCPHHETRVRDVTQPPGQQWVCVGGQ